MLFYIILHVFCILFWIAFINEAIDKYKYHKEIYEKWYANQETSEYGEIQRDQQWMKVQEERLNIKQSLLLIILWPWYMAYLLLQLLFWLGLEFTDYLKTLPNKIKDFIKIIKEVW